MWGDRAVPAWHRNLGAAPRWQGDEAGADVEATDSPDKQTTGPASSPGTGAKVWGHGQGDRVPVGLLGVMRKLWERSCAQMAAPGLGSGTRVIVGPFPLWNPPLTPIPTQSPSQLLPRPHPSPSAPLPPSLPQFPLQRAEMEPSCRDPHARAGLTPLAHLHRAGIRSPEPLGVPGGCPALPPAPGQADPSGSGR